MKTIVYGLGRFFHTNKQNILERYNIVGYCDLDREKWENIQGGMSREYLSLHIFDFDTILVCANPEDIVPDLVDNLNIPISKIKIYAYEFLKRKKGLCPFWGGIVRTQ